MSLASVLLTHANLAGFYACQIFWKGDPGIEYFTIKFPTEEIMRKWAGIVDGQRRMWQEGVRNSQLNRNTATSQNLAFPWMENQNLVNPYKQIEEDDDEDSDANTLVNSAYPSGSTFRTDSDANTLVSSMYPSGSTVHTDSNPNLGGRSRTNTMESAIGHRVPPSRFPMSGPSLQVRTNAPMLQPIGTHSPNQQDLMDSYFSPTTESPVSTRSSGQISMQQGTFPFPRQPVPHMPNGFDDSNRFTAPAVPRQPSRDGPANGYSNRGNQRPSLPPNITGSQSSSARFRSASSPDIQNAVAPRRMADPSQPGVPDMPAFPQHYVHQPGLTMSRGQTNSPHLAGNPQHIPYRPNTQSPALQQQRDRMGPLRSIPLPVKQDYAGSYQQPGLTRNVTSIDRIGTPGSIDARMMDSPSTSNLPAIGAASLASAQPTQLKVKVFYNAAAFTTTMVVPVNITYQSLKDRLDAKLSRLGHVSLASGAVKLKYLDDGDYISIQSDEDVQMAFETWREQVVMMQPMAEVHLYVQ